MRDHGSDTDKTGIHRFPCGHIARADAVRVHVRPERHAAWARCPRCGVIGVFVEQSQERQRWSRRGA